MKMVTGPGSEPTPNRCMFMGGIIVDDKMHVEFLGNIGLDVAQELQELLVTMAALADEVLHARARGRVADQ